MNYVIKKKKNIQNYMNNITPVYFVPRESELQLTEHVT